MDEAAEKFSAVKRYHEATKHHLQRYAAGPEALDWDDQPEAFRWYEGAEKIDLPLLESNSPGSADQSYAALHTPATIAPQPLTVATIASLFELSLGLSAWKEYGDARWALRCNPSSGNLHAEEGYAIINDVDQLTAGVYHYLSRDHQLEQRCCFAAPALPDNHFLIGLSSIHWREAWKYGERAFRYCQLDIGHAIAAIRYAAATLGWRVTVVEQASDSDIATLLGTNREQDYQQGEKEHADLLLSITTNTAPQEIDLTEAITASRKGRWSGVANLLSPKHLYQWEIIDDVTEACEKPATVVEQQTPFDFPEPLPSECTLSAATLIRQRRSAQAFDGKAHITSDTFYRMLDMTLPRRSTPPWDSIGAASDINLMIFVHRIEGLRPGMYALLRNPAMFETFKTAAGRETLQWQPVAGAPLHLPLYILVNANSQKVAATLSCHQGIAAQSSFSLGMIADCQSIKQHPWHYRRLYWEAGMIGQVLYLEAEAAGVRGTGIGCYFDNAVRELLGITDQRFQSLYHFTVGGPLVDERIATIPPYAHLKR